MKVRKFIGATAREALREARQVLGSDAVVLSTRNVEGGVEMLAIADRDMSAIVSGSASVPRASPRPQGHAEPVAAGREAAAPGVPAPSATEAVREDAVTAEIKSIRGMLERDLATLARTAERAATGGGAQLAAELKSMRAALDRQLGALVQSQAVLAQRAREAAETALAAEVKSMRALLQRELATIAWAESTRRQPLRAELMRRLLAAGFSARLTRDTVGRLPDDFGEGAAARWLRETLAAEVPCASPEQMVEQGGVYALVGPTGVGKTTTAAKIAARAALRFGARRLALITTDGYRLGAYDQLRAYAKILGVTVQAAQEPGALAALVAGLRDRHLVLIDTLGMGQRDPRLPAELAALDGAGAHRVLLLNAAAQGETLEDVVRAYRGAGLAGCILTKTDEAVKLGAALDCVARHALRVHYVANGQRVPEDLHAPNLAYLVHRALRATADGAFALADDEYGLVAPAPGAGAAHARG